MRLRQRLAFICTGAALATITTVTYRVEASVASAAQANITIDYSHETGLSPNAIAMDETGYQTPNVLANDTLEQQRFKTLGLGYVRMDLKFSTPGNPSSQIVCGGSGCDTGPTGDQWISSIKGLGAHPVVIVETASSTSDAANLVRHFNVNPSTGLVDRTLANYVPYWIVGNEPDLNGYSASTYSGIFNADNDSMKAVDPSIRIGGATTAWYDSTFLQTFLQVSGSRVDFVDFHGYPQQGCSSCAPSSASTLFQWAQGTGADVANLRSMIQQIVPARASQIAVEVGEWALDWGGGLQTNTNLNAVWSADVLGNILQNGGYSMFYGTKGNAIEWSSGSQTNQDTGQQVYLNLDDPKAPYHGYGMFTGEGLFPHFGTTLAATSTTLPNVDVFASDNPKNIVVVNKDPSIGQTAVFSLGSVASGTVDVWQKNQSVSFENPPVHLGSLAFSAGSFSYNLPALSATTFVVTPASSGTTTSTTTATTTATTSTTTVAPSTTSTVPSTASTTSTTAAPTTTTTVPRSDAVLASDSFQRGNQSLWGTASDGHLWASDAGTNTAFSISGNAGAVSSTAWSSYSAILGPSATDADVYASATMSAFSNSNWGDVLRWSDGNDWYKAYIDGASLVIQKKVAGATTVLASVPFTATSGTSYTIRFESVGSALSAKVWPTASTEPAGWMATANDTSFTSGFCGMRFLTQAGTVLVSGFHADNLSVGTPAPVTTSSTTVPTTSTTVPTASTTVVPTTTTTVTSATPPGSLQGTLVGSDTFARSNAAFWGTASDGLPWGGDANSQSAFSISSGTGYVGSTSSSYSAVLGPTLSNAEVTFCGYVSSFTSANMGAILRWTDGNDWYKAYVDGSSLVIQKKVAGAGTILGSVSFPAVAGVNYTLRFESVGTSLYAKVWQTGNAEPGWMVQASDSTFTSGRGGLRMLPQGGSVNYTSFSLYSL